MRLPVGRQLAETQRCRHGAPSRTCTGSHRLPLSPGPRRLCPRHPKRRFHAPPRRQASRPWALARRIQAGPPCPHTRVRHPLDKMAFHAPAVATWRPQPQATLVREVGVRVRFRTAIPRLMRRVAACRVTIMHRLHRATCRLPHRRHSGRDLLQRKFCPRLLTLYCISPPCRRVVL